MCYGVAMSRDINPFGLRMPPDLRAKLEESARVNGRSLNSEILARLGESIELDRRIEEHNKLDNQSEETKILLKKIGDKLAEQVLQQVIKKLVTYPIKISLANDPAQK